MPTKRVQNTTKRERGGLQSKEEPLREVPPEGKSVQVTKKGRRGLQYKEAPLQEVLSESKRDSMKEELLQKVPPEGKRVQVTKKGRRGLQYKVEPLQEVLSEGKRDSLKEELLQEVPPEGRVQKVTKKGRRGLQYKEEPLQEIPSEDKRDELLKEELLQEGPPEDKENIEIVNQSLCRSASKKTHADKFIIETTEVLPHRTRRNKTVTDTQQNDINPDEVDSTKKKPKSSRTKERRPSTDWAALDLNCSRKNSLGRTFNLKVSSWNTGGLKTWLKNGCLEYVRYDWPDIFCMQETNCSTTKFSDEMSKLKMYRQFWCSSVNEKVAGVAIFTVIAPVGVEYGIGDETMDKEGRCITAEFEAFYLVCVSTPDAGKKLIKLSKRLDWLKQFRQFVNGLEEKKPVIICGNMNVAHDNIDLAKPESNSKTAGFTQKERDALTDLLSDGYVDTWRHLYPDRAMYTYWPTVSSREKNMGWRLDHFLVSKEIIGNVCEVGIRGEVFGSKHCPMTLFLNF